MSVYPRVFITRINTAADESDVYEFLNEYCALRSFKLVYNEHGISRGFGFAECETQEDADTLLGLDGAEFMQRRLVVAPAKDKRNAQS